MTSLNGLGFSISLLKVADLGVGKSMLELLDAPAEANGWAAAVSTKTWQERSSATRDEGRGAGTEAKPSGLTIDPSVVKSALGGALEKVCDAEPDITKYDTVVGDGDCGIGLKRGAEEVMSLLSSGQIPDDAAVLMDHIVSKVETSMDGTSGALYAIYLNAVATGLRSQSSGSAKQQATAKIWGNAAKYALDAMSKYTPAKVGDRTLVDALAPFVESLQQSGDVKKAAQAADEGSQSTKGMKASLGRTVYVGGEGWQNVPDPGAYGLAVFFNGLAENL